MQTQKAQDERLKGQVFLSKDDQFLVDWLRDGTGCNSGEWFPQQVQEIHPVSRVPWFIDAVLSTITHIHHEMQHPNFQIWFTDIKFHCSASWESSQH